MNKLKAKDSEVSIFENQNYRGIAIQKVKTFVLQEAKRLNISEPWRLPPMRKLADHLGVSVATVQSAYRQLSKEGALQTDPNKASYVIPPRKQSTSRIYHIGIDFLEDDVNLNISWRGNLHSGMLREAMAGRNRIVFHQLPLTNLKKEHLKLEGTGNRLDGVILATTANALRWPELDAGIPAVFDFPPTLTFSANFVTADTFGAAKLCGEAFSAAGRKRPFLATHGELNSWAYAGLAAGYRKGTIGSHSLGIIRFGADEAKDPATLKEAFRNKTSAPDAIFCRSDYTAMAVLNILKGMEFRVPEDVSVVGGTGLILMNTEFFTMTRVFQPLPEIGAELVKRLLNLIESGEPQRQFPGVFLPCKFGGGATTTSEENKVLGISSTVSRKAT